MLLQTLPRGGVRSSPCLTRPAAGPALTHLRGVSWSPGAGRRSSAVLLRFPLRQAVRPRPSLGPLRWLSVTATRPADEQPRPPQRAPRLRRALQSLPGTHEDIYTLPNLLTLSRLVAAPFVGYCILHDQHAWAFGLFAYAGITDLLDGWIARRWNLKTVVGTVIDPMADKTLMTVLTVTLALKGGLPVWLAAIILGRDVGLGIAAIYYRWISLPPPKTFRRYWDFSLPSAEVRPTTISKYNTFLQLALMGVTTVAPVVPLEMGASLTIMQYVVAATTVWSGASYVFTKDAVKILSKAGDTDSPKGPIEKRGDKP